MKAWEILKALDEGEQLERHQGHLDSCWLAIEPEAVKGWLVENVDRYPVRIKPQIRKVLIVENELGQLRVVRQDEPRWKNEKFHGPFELKD